MPTDLTNSLEASGTSKGTVLICDDEDGPRLSLATILGKFDGFDVLLASNGPEALELAQSHRVDVAVLDIRMAGMSGIEVLERLKHVDPTIEVIMVTGFESSDTLRLALRLRASDYINKPFDPTTIRTAVAAAIQRRREPERSESTAVVATPTGPEPPIPPRPSSPPKKIAKILLVDDDPSVLELYGEFLGSAGYETVAKTSGQAALQELDATHFDLIFMDLVMPEMDGLDCISQIHRRKPTVPICVLSGINKVEFSQRAFELGAVDYFDKASNTQELQRLLDRIQSILSSKDEHLHNLAPMPREELPGKGLPDQVLADTTAAFIHKLTNEFTNLSHLVSELGKDLPALDTEQGMRLKQRQTGLKDAISATSYLLQRFRNTIGRYPGVLRRTDVRKILLDLEQHFAGRFSGHLSLMLTPDHCDIEADYELLWHLFENLIRNGLEALQGRDNGEVTVATSVAPDSHQLRVVIRDNGCGISPDVLPRIFDPNYSTKPKGMGIGLYLARRAAQIHRGQIDCQSRLGEGTTFTITLPLPIDPKES